MTQQDTILSAKFTVFLLAYVINVTYDVTFYVKNVARLFLISTFRIHHAEFEQQNYTKEKLNWEKLNKTLLITVTAVV